MESLISIFEHYMKTGGITMVPLVLCCLWMWLIIFYQLPFWQKKPYCEIDGIKEAFCHLKTDCRRHDKDLLCFLQGRAGQRRIRQITTIKVLAAIAPLLGLFGTVTGMIKTFQSVARFGLANPKALAGGISEAMITTQFGLFIAVPGIIVVVFLKRNATRRQAGIEQETRNLIPE
jgi:biopolymer transport protein ExbB